MGKNKRKVSAETLNSALTSPNLYRVDFPDTPMEKYTEALQILFKDPDFLKGMNDRNKLVLASKKLRVGTPELINLIRVVQQRDRQLADTIYAGFVQANLHSEIVVESYPFDKLLQYFVDYSEEGMQERVDRLAAYLDKIVFLADMLETLLIDTKDEMTHVFKDSVKFQQFDAVSATLKQLTGFFSRIEHIKHTNTPLSDLYFEYADSINAYMEKRLKTFSEKYRKILPLPKRYNEQELIAALNAFFGTDGKFDMNFIGHTEQGAPYMDLPNITAVLNSSEMGKLDSVVGKIPVNASRDFMSVQATNLIIAHCEKKGIFAPSK